MKAFVMFAVLAVANAAGICQRTTCDYSPASTDSLGAKTYARTFIHSSTQPDYENFRCGKVSGSNACECHCDPTYSCALLHGAKSLHHCAPASTQEHAVDALASGGCDLSPEFAAYSRIETVPVPSKNADWNFFWSTGGNRETPARAFTRVAYCVRTDDNWVWTSFDWSDEDRVGVPFGWTVDENVEDVNVFDNRGTQMEGGKLQMQFWSNCYGTGASPGFDHMDLIDSSRPDCFGHMQLASADLNAFAFTGWSNPGTCAITSEQQFSESNHADGTLGTNCQNWAGDGKSDIETYVLYG